MKFDTTLKSLCSQAIRLWCIHMLKKCIFWELWTSKFVKKNWDLKKCQLNVIFMMNYIIYYKESNASLDGPHVVKFRCIHTKFETQFWFHYTQHSFLIFFVIKVNKSCLWKISIHPNHLQILFAKCFLLQKILIRSDILKCQMS